MHDDTFSDHMSQYVEVYELWRRKCVVWYTNKRSYMFYNFMNLPNWIPWKTEEVSASFLVPPRAPLGITISVYIVHCSLQ